MAQPESGIRGLTPLLLASDLAASVAFYCDTLGFTVTEAWKPGGKLAWCFLRRGGGAIMLQQACDEDGPADHRGRGVEFFFLCDSADALHAEFTARGLRLESPQDAFYGMRQLFLRDPDGYSLCFQNPVAQAD